jgi:16S rRNA (cytidine1402-2'-O)-methyltransferase
MPTVYLIPAPLDADVLSPLPAYILSAIRVCQVFFVENERTTRRYFKKLDSSIVIDDYVWHNMSTGNDEVKQLFKQAIWDNQTIGIVSEAGCPGIADPGQMLVEIAHHEGAMVKPLVGPSSILLALMASGFNGQQFTFHGYLPVNAAERIKKIKSLEEQSARHNMTQIFIETPYRNMQMIESLVKVCHPKTQLCVAVNITGTNERIETKSIADWKKALPEIHKKPAIFLMMG